MWQYWARRRRLAVKTCLYGHSEAVTCLAASAAYNLVVSGSRDGQLIVWDVERGAFLRQLLPALPAPRAPPVAALAIDDLTVSLVALVNGTVPFILFKSMYQNKCVKLVIKIKKRYKIQ